jgi:MinD-like ATPase involved in chromosome partitioning or flagellar assembly
LDILAGAENRIAIAGLKRGQGTSTIAAAVTRWAVSNGKRVLLVDADLGNPELSRSTGLSPNVSWLNLLREDLIPSEAIIRSKSSGVCIMPLAAVVTPQTWPGPIYDRLGALIDQVRHGFDLILMDVGPVGQLSNELSASDLMLDALMIVDENPSSGEFVAAKSRLLKSGVRKFIAAQNSTGTETI